MGGLRRLLPAGFEARNAALIALFRLLFEGAGVSLQTWEKKKEEKENPGLRRQTLRLP